MVRYPFCSGFTFQRASTVRNAEVACPKTAHTRSSHDHCQVQAAQFSLLQKLFFQSDHHSRPHNPMGALFYPDFRDPASFIEERPDDCHIITLEVLGHSHPVDFDVRRKVFPAPDGVLVDSPVVGDDEGLNHCLGHILLPCFPVRPLSVLLVLLFERLVQVVRRRDLHNDDNLSPVARVTTEPHEVGLQPRSCNPSFVRPVVGPYVLGPDGDFILGCSHGLPLLPLLLVGDQSSLDEDVVEEDVHDDVVAGVDLSYRLLAAENTVLRVQLQTHLAAPSL